MSQLHVFPVSYQIPSPHPFLNSRARRRNSQARREHREQKWYPRAPQFDTALHPSIASGIHPFAPLSMGCASRNIKSSNLQTRQRHALLRRRESPRKPLPRGDQSNRSGPRLRLFCRIRLPNHRNQTHLFPLFDPRGRRSICRRATTSDRCRGRIALAEPASPAHHRRDKAINFC